jgi:trehalose 6-phosphate synthase
MQIAPLALGCAGIPRDPPHSKPPPATQRTLRGIRLDAAAYLNKSFNHRILSGFYRAARIGLVTPFRDGMNLVSKEYVAAQQPEDPGMLVLSCFAGAVRELGEAIIVNPYDLEGMAEGIWQGLQMPLEERRERWAAMMATLRRNDINAWRERFIAALTAAGPAR